MCTSKLTCGRNQRRPVLLRSLEALLNIFAHASQGVEVRRWAGTGTTHRRRASAHPLRRQHRRRPRPQRRRPSRQRRRLPRRREARRRRPQLLLLLGDARGQRRHPGRADRGGNSRGERDGSRVRRPRVRREVAVLGSWGVAREPGLASTVGGQFAIEMRRAMCNPGGSARCYRDYNGYNGYNGRARLAPARDCVAPIQHQTGRWWCVCVGGGGGGSWQTGRAGRWRAAPRSPSASSLDRSPPPPAGLPAPPALAARSEPPYPSLAPPDPRHDTAPHPEQLCWAPDTASRGKALPLEKNGWLKRRTTAATLTARSYRLRRRPVADARRGVVRPPGFSKYVPGLAAARAPARLRHAPRPAGRQRGPRRRGWRFGPPAAAPPSARGGGAAGWRAPPWRARGCAPRGGGRRLGCCWSTPGVRAHGRVDGW